MRLVSFNFRQGGLRRTENPWLRVLNKVGADVVCAQETAHPARFSDETLAACGGHIHELVAHGKWGSAIAYRNRTAHPITVPGFEGWVVGAKMASADLLGPWDGINVYSVHVPSPGPYQPRVHQLIDALAASSDGDPMIVAGDFNVTVSLGRESKTKSAQPERHMLNRLRCELGLLNAWQVLNPNCEPPQTLRWANDPKFPYHCDGVFVDARLLPRLESAEILQGDPWTDLSDHNPVVVSFH